MKGQMNTKVVTIAAAVLLFAVLFPLTVSYAETVREAAAVQSCKAEVLKASEVSKLSGPVRTRLGVGESGVQADCPRRDYEELGIYGRVIPKSRRAAETALITSLGSQLMECSDKFWQGTKNPVPGTVFGDSIHCYVCSEFIMPDKGDQFADVHEDLNVYFEDRPHMEQVVRPVLVNDEAYVFSVHSLQKDAGNFDEVRGKDLTLLPGEKYMVVNAFIINADYNLAHLFLTKQQNTFSRLFIQQEGDLGNMCTKVWN